MSKGSALTAIRLRELLHYCPDTGVFRWRVDAGRRGRVKAGTPTGSPDTRGHLRIKPGDFSDLKSEYSQLLKVGLVVGQQSPDGDIDHVDGVKGNNVFSNLRDVPHQVNTENRRVATRGKRSGLPMGVSIDNRDGAYRADITVNGKTISLGRHPTPDAAHRAYVEAKRRLHAGCTI